MLAARCFAAAARGEDTPEAAAGRELDAEHKLVLIQIGKALGIERR